MGPTVFLPRTNTAESHASFNDACTREAFLKARAPSRRLRATRHECHHSI
jgi:hypothetical protein